METVSEIIGTMEAVAPAGQRRLDDETLRQLRDLPRSRIAARTAPREARTGMPVQLAELAAEVTGNTKALNHGTALSTLVIRALTGRGHDRDGTCPVRGKCGRHPDRRSAGPRPSRMSGW